MLSCVVAARSAKMGPRSILGLRARMHLRLSVVATPTLRCSLREQKPFWHLLFGMVLRRRRTVVAVMRVAVVYVCARACACVCVCVCFRKVDIMG